LVVCHAAESLFTHFQEKEKSELPAESLKLIHSGKVLKDSDTLAGCGIKENDFLVVMVTKAKAAKPVAAPAAAAASAEATTEASVPAATASSETATTTTTTAAETTETTPVAAAAAASAETTTTADSFPDDAVQNLVAMGFPEPEVRHCLRVAHGNPDVAVEFLTNGIPEGVAAVAEGMNRVSATTSGQPLASLRNHAQFNELRRLVQSNPAMLQQVLAQIGQQQPALLEEINNNQALFLQMMNEPVTAAPEVVAVPAAARENAAGSLAGGGSPLQMAALIQNMPAAELERMATLMGIPADQLRATAEMIGSLPPEQLAQFMMQAAALEESGATAGMENMLGAALGRSGGATAGAAAPGVLRLTADEMAAVDRLTEMGFDRAEAAQAFLACDKNEALAANLLMDGGFGFGDGGDDAFEDAPPGDNQDDEDMYD
jgi:UV excision repair protein RAD23